MQKINNAKLWSLYDYYGIPYGWFDGPESSEGIVNQMYKDYTDARLLLMQDKELTEELEGRLLNYKRLNQWGI